MSLQSLPRCFRCCCGFAVLFAVGLACYTPQQGSEAERRAVKQLEVAVERLDYTPPGAVLLAEEHASDGYGGIESEYVGAEVNRLYGIDLACEVVVADYQEAMLAAGWKRRGGSGCDYPVWLSFYLESGEEFAIYAEPFDGANIDLAEEEAWRYQTIYFVNFRVRIPIE